MLLGLSEYQKHFIIREYHQVECLILCDLFHYKCLLSIGLRLNKGDVVVAEVDDLGGSINNPTVTFKVMLQH